MKLKNMLIVFGIVGLFSNIAYPANAQRQLTTKETEAKYAGENNQATATQLLNKEGKDIYFNKQEPKITKEEATKNAYALMFRGTSHLETSLKYEGSKPYYESIFTYRTMRILAEVDGLTGKVTEINALSMESKNLQALNLHVKGREYISSLNKGKAEEIALNFFKDTKVKDTTLSVYKGYWEYIVELIGNGDKAILIVDPENGKIIEVNYKINKEPVITPPTEVKPENKDILSKEEVIKIVLAKVPNGKVVEIELEKDDGKYIYEIEVMDDKYEYEFEIDAKTGKILDVDKDEIDED